MENETIQLGHGSGGQLSHDLVENTLLSYFDSPHLRGLPDSATLAVAGSQIAFTTDSYVVDPIIFPGGDIGKLAVCGTVNDLSVVGATPEHISCALILEEGLPQDDLGVILSSMEAAAETCDVDIVTGDTKVVPQGKADKLFINTAGVGTFPENISRPDARIQPGDAVVVTGPLGDHGAAVMAQRKGLNLQTEVVSDCAPLTALARTTLTTADRVSFLRDVTRGGLATILNEAVADENVGIILREEDIPVRPGVRSLCELLGIDPLYLACEGRLVTIIDEASAGQVVNAMKEIPGGEDACVVGRVTTDYTGQLVGETPYETHRLIQMLSGKQLPRIC